MTAFVAGLGVGTSAVTAWVATLDGEPVVSRTAGLPVRRPAPDRLEFDPTDWWAGCRATLAVALDEAPQRPVGLVVSAERQAFVLTDGRVELGHGVLGGDRRGAPYVADVAAYRQLYAMTRQHPTAETVLPKLLAVREELPRRWAAAGRLLLLADWVVWRLTGAEHTEVSQACAAAMAHVSQRTWAGSLLDDVGVPRHLLAPLVEAGTVLGSVRDRDLPTGLPVVAGCGGAQLVAAGAGAAHTGAVCVVAGPETVLVAGADTAPLDPVRQPAVSTHVPRDVWAVETSCGSATAMVGWLAGVLGVDASGVYELAGRSRPGAGGVSARSDARPATLSGITEAVRREDLAAAVTEAAAYAVRARLAPVEQVLGGPVRRLALAGPAASAELAQLLADVTDRATVLPAVAAPDKLAGVALVAAATGVDSTVRVPQGPAFQPRDSAAYDEPYRRFLGD